MKERSRKQINWCKFYTFNNYMTFLDETTIYLNNQVGFNG